MPPWSTKHTMIVLSKLNDFEIYVFSVVSITGGDVILQTDFVAVC